MQEKMFKLFEALKTNNTNTICFFRKGKKIQKTFAEFASDIEEYSGKLNYLKASKGITSVAIIGPTSYDWAVCEFACIKSGLLFIAIPETITAAQATSIIEETNANVLLLDYSLREKFNIIYVDNYYIECYETSHKLSFRELPTLEDSDRNLILEEYSIVFSSGTSEKLKFIKKAFPTIEKTKLSITQCIKNIHLYISYKRSFWSAKDNKLIIFMPFSHPQQRDFFRIALDRKINIILSDPQNCLKHIILEKPNIMVSVPIVYETMAGRIKIKLDKLNPKQKRLFHIFNKLKINSLSNRNFIKKWFSDKLFSDIRKIYGGRADYFVTGSAPISSEVIKIFDSVGVKLLQAYGQSEIGTIAINTHKNFRIGSVGKPLTKVRISEESEILVKYDAKLNRYNKDILNIDSEGFIHTGDLGYIDNEGYLFVTGRKDDVIVLENGKKVFPDKIESELKKHELINDAFIFSDNGYSISAILDCRTSPDHSLIQEIIDNVNSYLSDYEKIASYRLAKEPFSIENGMLTSTFKKKRNKIKELYYNNATI